jgi:hypothetical protein
VKELIVESSLRRARARAYAHTIVQPALCSLSLSLSLSSTHPRMHARTPFTLFQLFILFSRTRCKLVAALSFSFSSSCQEAIYSLHRLISQLSLAVSLPSMHSHHIRTHTQALSGTSSEFRKIKTRSRPSLQATQICTKNTS